MLEIPVPHHMQSLPVGELSGCGWPLSAGAFGVSSLVQNGSLLPLPLTPSYPCEEGSCEATVQLKTTVLHTPRATPSCKSSQTEWVLLFLFSGQLMMMRTASPWWASAPMWLEWVWRSDTCAKGFNLQWSFSLDAHSAPVSQQEGHSASGQAVPIAHVGYAHCHRVCLHRVNGAVVMTFFYVTMATHVTSSNVRVIEPLICTIMKDLTYKSASITDESVLTFW